MPRRSKQAVVYLIDLFICALATEAAFGLRLGFITPFDRSVAVAFVVAAVAWTVSAYAFRVYRSIFRFAGAGAILALVRAVTATAAVLIVAFGLGLFRDELVELGIGIPRTIAVIQPVIFLILLFFFRLVIRYVLIDLVRQRDTRGRERRVLVYGANAAGRQLAGSLKYEPGVQHLGYLDDDAAAQGGRIDGLPIWHSSQAAQCVDKLGITDVMLAMPDLPRSQRLALIERTKGLGVHVLTLPPIHEVMDGKVSYQDLREVDLADLLGRDPVPPDEALLQSGIRDKVVLVTGAGGSIGSELCRQIVAIGAKRLILCEMNEYSLYAIERELSLYISRKPECTVELVPELLNVAEIDPVARVFRHYRPETVFHAAAYKHVPLVEANPLAGLRNNIFGTLYCASEAERCGVENFILVSTDKAVRPTSVMGASKRACEIVLQALAARGNGKTRFAMVRFGNVLGSSGSVVPVFKQQIAEGGPVTITHRDITRYFMTIPEAALLVIQAGAMARGGEVYVLDMGQAVKIHDLACTMIQLSGFSVRNAENPDGDIEIVEVGLRPGEKLYEELLIGDNPLPTPHPRIMQAHENRLEWPQVEELLRRMSSAIAIGDRTRSISLISEMVVEYGPESVSSAA
ncbi:MAG: nucleoside-diphosphate sugar epimerase/dehydratase [Novosphingobium sp.]